MGFVMKGGCCKQYRIDVMIAWVRGIPRGIKELGDNKLKVGVEALGIGLV